jgi:hypothetical protein
MKIFKKNSFSLKPAEHYFVLLSKYKKGIIKNIKIMRHFCNKCFDVHFWTSPNKSHPHYE